MVLVCQPIFLFLKHFLTFLFSADDAEKYEIKPPIIVANKVRKGVRFVNIKLISLE